MSPVTHFILGTVLLALCFIHPLFIALFVIYLFILNVDDKTTYTPLKPSLHGPDLQQSDPQAYFMHKKSAYLQSSIWSQKRNQILQRDNYACVHCGRHTSLNVHHIRYSNIFNEQPADLLTLCSDCHMALHERVGYPQTYNDYMTKEYS